MNNDDILLILRLAFALAVFLTIYGICLGASRSIYYRVHNQIDHEIRCIDAYAYGAEMARTNGCNQ